MGPYSRIGEAVSDDHTAAIGGVRMIDIKVSIAFSILNLTEFEWSDLQKTAEEVMSPFEMTVHT